jgi:hypothetical protein
MPVRPRNSTLYAEDPFSMANRHPAPLGRARAAVQDGRHQRLALGLRRPGQELVAGNGTHEIDRVADGIHRPELVPAGRGHHAHALITPAENLQG